jgi:Flp pilus assembly protein CpaB
LEKIMAEQTQGIGSKWLLLTAVILGALVVFIYNAHIRAIRKELAGDKISLVKVTRDFKRGEKITARYVEREQIPRSSAKAFGNVLRWKDLDILRENGGRVVNQPINKGQLLLWDQLLDFRRNRPSSTLREGMIAIPIEFSADQSLGDILSVGDTVNLKGMFAIGSTPARMYRIISALRVLNVGGRGATEQPARGSGGMRNYRKITVEVDEDVSLQLSNVFSHMIGKVQLELRRRGAKPPAEAGEINPALASLASQARVQRAQRARR